MLVPWTTLPVVQSQIHTINIELDHTLFIQQQNLINLLIIIISDIYSCIGVLGAFLDFSKLSVINYKSDIPRFFFPFKFY